LQIAIPFTSAEWLVFGLKRANEVSGRLGKSRQEPWSINSGVEYNYKCQADPRFLSALTESTVIPSFDAGRFMIGRTLFYLLVSATLLVMPPALSGKAGTARVTITGGGLDSPIQITDAKVLELSHAWGGGFLDASRPPLAQAPNVDSPYEVTFYSWIADNDIRKTCVFFYSPGSAAAPGVSALVPR
jgi:hypothetical protein